MTFRDFLAAIRRRWLIVTVTTVVVALAATVTSLLVPRVYTSHILLYVSSQTGDNASTAYQGGLLSEQRVSSYVELVNRPSVATEIARRLDPPGNPLAIANEISASSEADSVLVDVSVQDTSPARATEIANVFGDVFPALVERIEAPRVPGREPPVSISPVEAATTPLSPSTPGLPTVLALAVLVGLVLGSLAAVLRDRLDTSVTTREKLERVIGSGTLATTIQDDSVASRPLIVTAEPRAPLSESFRALRTNLTYLHLERSCPVFVITSSSPGEGKTLTSCNVAAAIAAGEKRVLLIDADLRAPRVATYLGIEGQVGLTTVLTGRLAAGETVQRSAVARFDVLASGPLPPNPSELLSSAPMTRVLEWARAIYDVVIVDTPPVLAVTDAAALAPSTDGAILVCRHGVTTEAQLKAAADALTAVSARVLGGVLSRAPRRGAGAYSGYGYGYGTGPDEPGGGAPAAEPAVERPNDARTASMSRHAIQTSDRSS